MKRTLFVISLALIALFSTASVHAENPPVFILKWGIMGTGDGQLFYPLSASVDSQGNVYVADYSNHRVQKFTSGGMYITKWGSFGLGDGQFNRPSSIVVDALGNVYVADAFNSRVQKFTSEGVFITKWGTSGSGDGQFNLPMGIAVDAIGNVYVTEFNNNRVQKFTSTGQFLLKWGSSGSGDGQFDIPYGIAVDGQGNVFVSEMGNWRVQKFNADGQFLTKWGSYGSGDGRFTTANGIAIDNQGNVYVADHSNDYIQKFTNNGQFLTRWGSHGSGDGLFYSPSGVAVDHLGNIYLADSGNNRIQKFGYPPAFRILTIKDVGNDQGRLARINFLPSDRDTIDSPTPILQYEAYRRIDPLLSAGQSSAPAEVKGQPLHPSALLKAWEFVGAIPAHGEDEYNMIVPTLADSTKDKGIYWSRFFIRATTASPYVYFDSPVDSGYSVDNLAPNVPVNFNINTGGFLVWDPSLEKDLRFYTVYASNSPEFDGSKVVFGRTTNTTYDARLGTTKYYYLTATDFSGNEGKPATTELRPIAVLLSLFEAERKPSSVVIRWQVGEPDYSRVSFEVYREENGGRLKLNAEALQGQESYYFTDNEAPREAANYWLKSLSPDEQWHGPIQVSGAPPLSLQISAFPNPFNPVTTITYTVPVTGEIELSVYDVSGKLVRTLIDHERKIAGQYQFAYQHHGGSGVFFAKLSSGKENKTQKIVVLK